MKQHLLIAFLIPWAALSLLGCRTRPYQPNPQPLSANSFMQVWRADLNLKGDSVRDLNVRDNLLVVYTEQNKGYWLGASGGNLLNINQIANPGHELYPPVSLPDRIAIPTTGSVQIFDHQGNRIASFVAPTAIQSPAAAIGNSLFVGVAHAGSGRLARYDIDSSMAMVWEMYTTDGIVAAPAVIGDSVYAGGLAGRVWAVNINRLALWGLPNNSFETAAPITAGLSVDDFGVYVPSHDKKLYCLDRATGKIKWSYYAGLPLIDQPIIAGNNVYQPVPNRGLVSLNKSEGDFARKPMWTAPGIRQVLAVDDHYVYGASDANEIVALDRATGQRAFTSQREDLRVFATNLQSPIIYAATKNGTILAIRPVLKPGTVGEIVLNETPIQGPAVALAD